MDEAGSEQNIYRRQTCPPRKKRLWQLLLRPSSSWPMPTCPATPPSGSILLSAPRPLSFPKGPPTQTGPPVSSALSHLLRQPHSYLPFKAIWKCPPLEIRCSSSAPKSCCISLCHILTHCVETPFPCLLGRASAKLSLGLAYSPAQYTWVLSMAPQVTGFG